MRPRKISFESSDEQNYPAILLKYCQEEDMLIIPEIVIFCRNQFHFYNYNKKLEDFQAQKNVNNFLEKRKVDEVIVIYETNHDRDYPVTVLCKNLFVEPSFINGFGKSLEFFPTLDSLKIEECCISHDLAKLLALRLSEDPGKQISDLSLDGNPDVAVTLNLFIILPNGLKSLSVERCGLDDEAVKVLGLSLEYSSLKGSKLQVLNLGMNRIGDRGVSYLARALRINRTLNSLSLAGNQIGDTGLTFLAEVLQEFSLTYEEIFNRKKLIFENILKKQRNLKENHNEFYSEKELHSEVVRPGNAITSRKIRGRNSKIYGSTEYKKNKSNLSKTIFTNKLFELQQLNDKEDVLKKSEFKIANKYFPNFLTQDEIPDTYTFVNEVFISNGKLFCQGCWSLFYLNIAYNYLTEKSVETLTKVLQYQYYCKKFFNVGLRRVILLPGNCIQENSNALKRFCNAMSHEKNEPE